VRAVPEGRHVRLGLDRLISLDPIAFSRQWVDAWNAHDVEAVLEHFHDDVVFTSPVALRLLPETGGVVRGKPALRHYWTTALTQVPNLRFTVEGVYQGIDTVVIAYRNQDDGLVNEVLKFDDGLVVEGHGTYLT
jgi:ketosteroid isomerase-like protein